MKLEQALPPLEVLAVPHLEVLQALQSASKMLLSSTLVQVKSALGTNLAPVKVAVPTSACGTPVASQTAQVNSLST